MPVIGTLNQVFDSRTQFEGFCDRKKIQQIVLWRMRTRLRSSSIFEGGSVWKWRERSLICTLQRVSSSTFKIQASKLKQEMKLIIFLMIDTMVGDIHSALWRKNR